MSPDEVSQIDAIAGESAQEVDIPKAFCGQIRDFARRLPDMTYHEVLGVPPEANDEMVRHAFFERSKTFHPDRYFNKLLGPYEGLLHEIYKRVVAAHEVLRDEHLRADYERTLREKPGFRIGVPTFLLGLPGEERAPGKPSAGKSLRERKGLGSRDRILMDLEIRLAASRQKARAHFDEVDSELERGNWTRAASLVRLALAFDPREPEYHQALAEILPRANAEVAETARAKGEMLLSRGDPEGALEFLEQAFRLVPTDAELAHEVAEILLNANEGERAEEFALRAVELDEKHAPYRKALGLILMKRGLAVEARKELQRAWELDPMDREVKQALAVL